MIRSVFDVTKGKSHYGEGGGYNHFSGRFVRLCNPFELAYLNFVLSIDLFSIFPQNIGSD